jgi:glutathione synthase/RimK-type ligase-like ATP-grasp enzyme
MSILIVVNNPTNWPLETPGVLVVSARSYLSERAYSELDGAKVFNLCRSYRYQSLGYYVSLLAEARGHKPMPSITTIQDLKSLSMMRFAAEDLEEVIQDSLGHLHTQTFTLSIYFGRNVAKRYDRLALKLFNAFPAPLLRAHFALEQGVWGLQSIGAISASDIPEEHRTFVVQAAAEYFAGRRNVSSRRVRSPYDLAILFNPELESKPSTQKTIPKFLKAARDVGLEAEVISKDDYGKLAEFDALFIRETTAVNHHTYRFSRRAAAEGLVVIDDPESIVRCSNKVFLAELLDQHEIGHPKTLIVHKDNVDEIPLRIGLPCVLKAPDSAFSQGVKKAKSLEELVAHTQAMLSKSELIIAQEFLPSEFDWRVGVLDNKPLFVCKYHMVRGHWQIVGTDAKGERDFGEVECVAVEDTPRKVLSAALRVTERIGDGLYGVDLKQGAPSENAPGGVYVIEVNDNPNIDAGYEDQILGPELYIRIMNTFLHRIRKLRDGHRRAV